eukprot:m.97029 g.97029  ORF g.97029 m.97029 type:complete len:579 (-) comp16682_c0_seq2:356-2092(-)
MQFCMACVECYCAASVITTVTVCVCLGCMHAATAAHSTSQGAVSSGRTTSSPPNASHTGMHVSVTEPVAMNGTATGSAHHPSQGTSAASRLSHLPPDASQSDTDENTDDPDSDDDYVVDDDVRESSDADSSDEWTHHRATARPRKTSGRQGSTSRRAPGRKRRRVTSDGERGGRNAVSLLQSPDDDESAKSNSSEDAMMLYNKQTRRIAQREQRRQRMQCENDGSKASEAYTPHPRALDIPKFKVSLHDSRSGNSTQPDPNVLQMNQSQECPSPAHEDIESATLFATGDAKQEVAKPSRTKTSARPAVFDHPAGYKVGKWMPSEDYQVLALIMKKLSEFNAGSSREFFQRAHRDGFLPGRSPEATRIRYTRYLLPTGRSVGMAIAAAQVLLEREYPELELRGDTPLEEQGPGTALRADPDIQAYFPPRESCLYRRYFANSVGSMRLTKTADASPRRSSVTVAPAQERGSVSASAEGTPDTATSSDLHQSQRVSGSEPDKTPSADSHSTAQEDKHAVVPRRRGRGKHRGRKGKRRRVTQNDIALPSEPHRNQDPVETSGLPADEEMVDGFAFESFSGKS